MKKIILDVSINKVISIAKDGLIFAGVDVHKSTYHIALWNTEYGLLKYWVAPASPAALVKQLSAIQNRIVRVVYEAGPTGFGLARFLRANGFAADVIAPSKLPQLPGRNTKTDQLDCKNLAKLASHKMLYPIYLPSEEEEADRQVVRLREQCTRKLRRIKQQIKSFLLQYGIAEPEGLKHWSLKALAALRQLELCPQLHFCLDTLLDELDWRKTNLRSVTQQIKALTQCERHKTQVELLRSIPGVGLITAMTFRTELPAPHRFTEGPQVARIIGLAPLIRQSGESSRSGSLMKSGNWRIRTMLVEAAWRWIRYDQQAKDRYLRLVRNTGNSKKAIVGVARNLALCMWRISIRAQPYITKAA